MKIDEFVLVLTVDQIGGWIFRAILQFNSWSNRGHPAGINRDHGPAGPGPEITGPGPAKNRPGPGQLKVNIWGIENDIFIEIFNFKKFFRAPSAPKVSNTLLSL